MKDTKNIKKQIVKVVYKFISLFVAFCSSSYLWYCNVGRGWKEGYKGYLTLALVGLFFCIVYWFFVKLYQAQRIGNYRLTELTFFQILSFGIADFTLIVESIFWFHGLKRIYLWTFVLGYVLQILIICIVIFICNRLYAKYDEPRKILVVYGSEGYRDFIKKIHKKKYRYTLIECLNDGEEYGTILSFVDKCDSIYLYEVNEKLQKDLVMFCDRIEKDIYITLDVESWIERGFEVSHTFDTPFLRPKKAPVSWYYPIFKRCFDLFFSSIGIVVLSPLLMVIIICIKLFDRGPVLYKQIRLTENHKEFYIYKFRSMVVNAEKYGAKLASKNDERVTPIGKILRVTHLDELPQLFNILRGDMSFVGPRPERPEIEEMYLKEIPEFALRLKVKAGLTGYAQVFGKYNTSPEDKLKLDLIYIYQRSMLQDLKLIFYTIKIMFTKESSEGIDMCEY